MYSDTEAYSVTEAMEAIRALRVSRALQASRERMGVAGAIVGVTGSIGNAGTGRLDGIPMVSSMAGDAMAGDGTAEATATAALAVIVQSLINPPMMSEIRQKSAGFLTS